MDDTGFPVKAEEFVVLSQEPSVTETIAPKIARPFIEVRLAGACLASLDLELWVCCCSTTVPSPQALGLICQRSPSVLSLLGISAVKRGEGSGRERYPPLPPPPAVTVRTHASRATPHCRV